MPATFEDLVRDVIVLAYMVVLRIGVPILITILLGKWVERKLKERDAARRRVPKNAAYCWEREQTPETRRAQRAAEQRPDLPCWLALQVCGITYRGCQTCHKFKVNGRRQPAAPGNTFARAAGNGH